jgi:transposase
MLADDVDFVIGVDTHRDSHTAATVNPAGAVQAELTVPAEMRGYRRLLDFAEQTAGGRRCWAIEGTGSFGAGLTAFLLEGGERVVEIDRPKRPARRNGAKSDQLDAVRAAREALTRKHLAEPRQRGWREAVRVLLATRQGAITARTKAITHLKALLVSAPDQLREELRHHGTERLLARCARLRICATHDAEHGATMLALRTTARRALALQSEADELDAQLLALITDVAPDLLAEPGVGPITAAQLLVAFSHHRRLRSEAAFAALGGAAPVPASSGQIVRYRLNRGGDRQLNRALHTIAICRLRHDPVTQLYAARRAAEGKTPRDIKRCLKRYLARRLYRLLEANPNLGAIAATSAP